LFARVADETGFVVAGHALDVFGLCPDCARHRQ
jgi:Fe2+ or Zn2+ uptake regulation protein